MQVSKEGIERIKSANPLAEVVAERGIALKKKGKSLQALCPFHQEKTPSFSLSKEKGLFKCFGCGESGDVIGFVSKHDRMGFPAALDLLARRAGLDLAKLMEERPRISAKTPLEALTPPPAAVATPVRTRPSLPLSTPALLGRVVEHYHRTLLEREDARAYLEKRGLTDQNLWRVFKLGYADGSLLKLGGKEIRDELVSLGVVTSEGRELLGGCLVIPIPDSLTGTWTTLYGRGVKTDRHCYLPGPLRGVLNYQAALLASEVVLTESVIDALSFHQAGITSAVPLYGVNGFTDEHLDTLLKNPSKRVVLCLDNDEAGRKATDALKERLERAGIRVRLSRLPEGTKDPNELLVSRNGDGPEALRAVLRESDRAPSAAMLAATQALATVMSVSPPPPILTAPSSTPVESSSSPIVERTADGLLARFPSRIYHVRAGGKAGSDSLRAVLRMEAGGRFLVDTLDLYAARSRREYTNRAVTHLGLDKTEVAKVEDELLRLIASVESLRETESEETKKPAPMTAEEREEALDFLRLEDLLDQVGRDIDLLGYVGEETLMRLLYLIAISRKLSDPCSGIVLSQSGAGKSGATEVIERLTPPEDVVLFTRLTPQSLYYTEPGVLDHKLVIIEERYGSVDADYSVRILQSRKKLSVAVPIKDPQTGSLRTKVFMVEARAAFIEATTASSVNHENATRCFELVMDESPEQTKKIHERQRTMRTEAGLLLRQKAEEITRRHWNAQRLLEPLPVVIPFADLLTFPSSWMRTRRDHARFLNLIEVSAFLYQYQRERRSGAIVASERDYEVAYALSGEVLSETLTDLRKPLRDFLGVVRKTAEKKGEGVTRRELRALTSLPDTTLIRYLRDLVELEYLKQLGGKDKPLAYAPADDASVTKTLFGLLSPEELKKRLRG